MIRRHIVVIDPGTHRAELDALNQLALMSDIPVTYHLPAMAGVNSLQNEKVEAIAGFVIFGSLSSVNDWLAWQKDLETWILPKLETKIPCFGVCYGHQMLAHVFGGKVGYISPDKEKLLGQRKIHLVANPLWGNKSLDGEVCVSHCEVVTQVPDNFQITGTSDMVKVEAMAHRTLPIWSFQSHPEATSRFLSDRGHLFKEGSRPLDFGHTLLKSFLKLAKGS